MGDVGCNAQRLGEILVQTEGRQDNGTAGDTAEESCESTQDRDEMVAVVSHGVRHRVSGAVEEWQIRKSDSGNSGVVKGVRSSKLRNQTSPTRITLLIQSTGTADSSSGR